jgi:putative ABC transport system permease protein
MPEGFRRWLRLPRSRARAAQDVSDEIAFHLAMRAEKLRATGLPEEEAQRRARERFGDASTVAERCVSIDLDAMYAERREDVARSLWQDIRYASRALRRAPAFTIAALVTLALGIGATTTVFSIVYGVLLRPLPYREPDRLVMLWEQSARTGNDRNPVSVPNYQDWLAQTRGFSGIAAYAYNRYTLTGAGEAEQVQGTQLFGDAFAVLGVRPLAGRGIGLADARSNVVVLSDGLWRRRFGADPAILGASIRMNGEPYTVVGIMPASFQFPRPDVELWTGYRTLLNDPAWAEARGRRFQRVIARLKPGVTVAAAASDVNVVANRLAAQFPDANAGGGATAVSLRDELVGNWQRALLVLFGAVACVLLIGCANVAHLLLARTAARERELAVRAALGAGRGRLVRQLLTESLVVASAGGALGVALAYVALRALRTFSADVLPLADAVRVDAWALAFCVGAVGVTAILVGLVPALRATRRSLAESVRDGGRGAGAGTRQRTTQAALVVAEVGLSVVLLVGAGLLLRSFDRLRRVDTGVDATGVVTMLLVAPPSRYPTPDETNAFFDRVTEGVSTLPAVQSVGLCDCLPPTQVRTTTSLFIDGESRGDAARPLVNAIRVGGRYFGALGIRVLTGRAFTSADRFGAPAVGIVNRTLAVKLLHTDASGSAALGRRVSYDGSNWATIVGVVDDVHYDGLAATVMPGIYTPLAQQPEPGYNLIVRTAGEPMTLVPAIRRVIAGTDPEIAPSFIASLEGAITDSLAGERFNSALLGAFAGIAFVLAAVGIYGVVAYGVSQRQREMGVRIALGAQGADVVRMVVAESLRPVLVGVAFGLLAAAASTRVLQRMLYGTSVHELDVYLLVPLALVVVAAAAAWLPGRRAAGADPMAALRAE